MTSKCLEVTTATRHLRSGGRLGTKRPTSHVKKELNAEPIIGVLEMVNEGRNSNPASTKVQKKSNVSPRKRKIKEIDDSKNKQNTVKQIIVKKKTAMTTKMQLSAGPFIKDEPLESVNEARSLKPTNSKPQKGKVKKENELEKETTKQMEQNAGPVIKEEALESIVEANSEPAKIYKKGNASASKRKTGVESVKKEVKVKVGSKDIEDIGWEPQNWREVLDNILKMRKLYVAPVDSLGCEECPEKDCAPEVFRYQTLISVMLSSQTRDEVTYAATQRLIEHGLTVDNILNTADEKIGELIYPAGFWKSKIKFIKNTTQVLKEQYKGDIPRTFTDLCKLPGVGPKMANIVMSVAWSETVGIAVDTHVHRISNRLGWVPKTTKTPEQTRKALESWLPKDQWRPINVTLVGFGQTVCKPVGPSCAMCFNKNLCPVGRSSLSGKKTKT